MIFEDLKDASYSIPIHPNHQNILNSFGAKNPINFKACQMGIKPVMRVFTKISKPQLSFLRKNGHILVVFVEDTYFQGHSFQECHITVKKIIRVQDKMLKIMKEI